MFPVTLVGASGIALPASGLVDAGWLAAHLGRPDVRLIDVSSSRQVYERGHLPRAVYVSARADLVDPTHPMKGMAPTRAQFQALMRRLDVRNTDTVVFYDDVLSTLAARAFWVCTLYRHERVAILDGGSHKWKAEGGLVVTEEPALKPSAYAAGDRDGNLEATADSVLAGLGRFLVLDVRSAQEYRGFNARAARGGHIPEAVHVEWSMAMRPDETFGPIEDLRDLYCGAGVTGEREVVVYCQTGVRSAHTWFVLRFLLGYPHVRNYGAGWEEWGNRSDLPVSR